MKKILTLLMLLCFFISCEKKEPNFSKEMIAVLANRGEVQDGGLVRLPPPPATFLDLFIKTDNNEILLTNSDYLFDIYKQFYFDEFKSFSIFLNEVLNENFVFKKEIGLLKSFKVNSEIEKEYVCLGFDDFLKKYTTPSSRKNELEFNRSNVKPEDYKSFRYILYINRYDSGFDDYHAKYYITKREDSFK